MKRIKCVAAVIALFFGFLSYSYAQEARIVEIKGNVQIQKSYRDALIEAKPNMTLTKGASLQTGKDSQCSLVFDQQRQNIMTLKPESAIKIEDVRNSSGVVFLSKGKVFTLIKNLKSTEKFQVKTPTAVAGARGTGWSTGYEDNKTSAQCFDDVIFVQGLDEKGNATGEQEITAGFGVDVDQWGAFGDQFSVSEGASHEWQQTIVEMGNIMENNSDQGVENPDLDAGMQNPGSDDVSTLQDQRGQDVQENTSEKIREEIEESTKQKDTGGSDNQEYHTIQG